MLSVLTIPSWVLLAALSVPVLWGIFYYGLAIRGLQERGGHVGGRFFGSADLFFGSALAAYFVWMGVSSLAGEESIGDMSVERLLSNGVFMIAILGTVVFFTKMRGLPFFEAMGLEGRDFGSLIFRTIAGLAMALPIVWAMNTAFHVFVTDSAKEQALVTIFRSASESGNWEKVASICLSGVVVAPVVEETLFRGYFYPVLKRFGGPLWSSFLVSAIFALSHGNTGAMAGLFALAICLTVSYERYGSLWVSVGMHAGFNAISLVLLYLQGRGWMPT